MKTRKLPDKIHVVNRITNIAYMIKVSREGLPPIELSITEFQYLHDAFKKFEKQTGWKGFK